MSDVLARIRVKEEHGIRRFLYPLSAQIELAKGLDYEQLGIATRDNDLDLTRLQLVNEAGLAVPLAITHVSHKDENGIETGRRYHLDFAVSQGPREEHQYCLRPTCTAAPTFSDFLHLSRNGDRELTNTQQHFSITLGYAFPRKGTITEDQPIAAVVYDGVKHFRSGLTITRNGSGLQTRGGTRTLTTALNASEGAAGWSEGEFTWITTTQITACKSWANVSHHFDRPKTGDQFTFSLPFAASASPMTCDFGIGGGTFGKLERGKAEEIVWRTEFTESVAHWSLATAGRVDYVGQTSLDDFHAQRWFHLIDNDKALAVAITEVPASCQEMLVSLNIVGDVIITFRLSEPGDRVKFGVCYHFLNDIPAIAAATNPQSILLPPTVEVLPA